jgi:hypothetical protein
MDADQRLAEKTLGLVMPALVAGISLRRAGPPLIEMAGTSPAMTKF